MTLVYCIVLHCAHPLVGSVSGTLPGGPVKGEGACMTCPEHYVNHFWFNNWWVLPTATFSFAILYFTILAIRRHHANLN